MGKIIKKRNWAMVLYPESAPADWREQLQQTGLQGAISPLHDSDTDTDGETVKPKKAHYHIILCYAGPTSYAVVKSLTDKLGQPHPQPLEQVRGYYRYFTHKDNPEKYQYDEKNISCFNGFSISDFVELTKSEVTKIKKELQTLIRTIGFYEYADLMDYLQDNGLDEQYDVASNNTYFFDKYISSRRHKAPVVDPRTGEVKG